MASGLTIANGAGALAFVASFHTTGLGFRFFCRSWTLAPRYTAAKTNRLERTAKVA